MDRRIGGGGNPRENLNSRISWSGLALSGEMDLCSVSRNPSKESQRIPKSSEEIESGFKSEGAPMQAGQVGSTSSGLESSQGSWKESQG